MQRRMRREKVLEIANMKENLEGPHTRTVISVKPIIGRAVSHTKDSGSLSPANVSEKTNRIRRSINASFIAN